MAATWRLGALVALVVVYLGAASLLSLATVRVGFDLWSGIDPFLPPERRPFLGAVELAHRAFAVDAPRQVFLAALVLGGAWWRDRAGWRRRLALDRERPNGMRPVALLGLLLIWPVLHIAWVTGTAELFGASFGQHVRLSPFMSQAAVAAWLAYLAILAPVAEELLLRGEAFARASAAVGPAGAILVTALRHRMTIAGLLARRLEKPLPPNATALSHILHAAAAQILFLDVPDSAAVDLAVLVQRYLVDKTTSLHIIWRFNHKVRVMPPGRTLRVETLASAVVRWSVDNWRTVHDTQTRDTTLGVHVADLQTEDLRIGDCVNLTFHWSEADRWEGANFVVCVE